MQRPNGEFWRMPRVLAEVGFKKSMLYKLMKEKQFPAPLKIGRASVWPQADVEQWKDDRLAGREWGRDDK